MSLLYHVRLIYTNYHFNVKYNMILLNRYIKTFAFGWHPDHYFYTSTIYCTLKVTTVQKHWSWCISNATVLKSIYQFHTIFNIEIIVFANKSDKKARTWYFKDFPKFNSQSDNEVHDIFRTRQKAKNCYYDIILLYLFRCKYGIFNQNKLYRSCTRYYD